MEDCFLLRSSVEEIAASIICNLMELHFSMREGLSIFDALGLYKSSECAVFHGGSLKLTGHCTLES